jgi:hypothetical protein
MSKLICPVLLSSKHSTLSFYIHKKTVASFRKQRLLLKYIFLFFFFSAFSYYFVKTIMRRSYEL